MVIQKDFNTHGLAYFLYGKSIRYSSLKDIAYCLPCYLFSRKTSRRHDSNVFIVTCN